MDQQPISFTYDRRFGVEMEFCSTDNRDFKRHPLQRGELPEGSEYIAQLLMEKLKTTVEIARWHNTHHNVKWIVKPDRSCGIELCSPVSKGWRGVKEICQAVEVLRKDGKINSDQRCGLHMHIDMSDRSTDDIGQVLSHWIKCESVFLDSMPMNRKRNTYCRQIGLSPLFEHDSDFTAEQLIQKLGSCKYYTINAFHLFHGDRQTIEVRIADNEGNLNEVYMRNWIRLLIHFVEQALTKPIPKYKKGDCQTGFQWLDPISVMDFLGFLGPVSKGLEETRNWFIARLMQNMRYGGDGVWSMESRKVAINEISQIITRLGLEKTNFGMLLVPGSESENST